MKYAFLFGLTLSLVVSLAGLTGLIKQALLNYQATGKALNGKDPLMILSVFLLLALLITFGTDGLGRRGGSNTIKKRPNLLISVTN